MNESQSHVAIAKNVQNGPAARSSATFGPFQLNLAERLLTRGAEPVAVGGRALDILSKLIAHAGDIVSKEDLFKSAWPGVAVEDTTLRVQIANLRKMLGDGRDGARYIACVSGRGYCFVAPVRYDWAAQNHPPVAPTRVSQVPSKLPARRPCIVGRDGAVATVVSLLRSDRFVSIVGPGGIGKTTVALAATHVLADDFEGEMFFVDLGALTDASLLVPTIASALGCIIQARDPTSALIAFLGDKRACLVLDSCEHLIDAVATIAGNLFNRAPLVSIMTTTREALRVTSEIVYPLPPLEGPPNEDNISAVRVLASPSVQLFMQRVAASGCSDELTDADAPIVADICRRLDGIALAIEIVASQVGAHGVRGIGDLLNHQSKLLWQGRRNASPRHKTLQAMLDWSYSLLSAPEQNTLRHLGVFVGSFTLEAARSVAEDSDDALGAIQAIADLVAKSLISTSIVNGSTYYRLLDTTRAYVVAKRAGNGNGENDRIERRHALYYLSNLANLEAGREPDSTISLHIGNIRAALEWSFSPRGDLGIGVELAAYAAPLFLRISLLSECQHWCERGLAASQDSYLGTPEELALLKAFAISSMFTNGSTSAVRAAIERGLEVAQISGNVEYQLHFLSGLNLFLARRGDFAAALEVAERNSVVAAKFGPAGLARAEWMLGATHNMLGNQVAAKDHCELGFKLAAISDPAHVNFFGYNHHLRARVALARNQWLRGFPDQAVRTAHQAIDEGAMCDHPATLCISLLHATYVFFWCGEFEEAGQVLEKALALTLKHSLPAYHAVGFAMKGELLVLSGAYAEGVELLQTVVPALLVDDHHVRASAALRAQAEGLAHCGRPSEARALIATAVARAETLGGTFDLPNLIRAQGEILLASSSPDIVSAERLLVRSIELARKQAAVGWELRSAIALARLWGERGCHRQAGEMLNDLYCRFTEGFETSDLRKARKLLKGFDYPVN